MEGKAVWNAQLTEVFIELCVEQVYLKLRKGQTFEKKGWMNIVQKFNERTGKCYDKKQMKNRFDILRKDLKLWDSLLKETGVGRDPTTNNLVASTTWWKDHPKYKKFMHTPLQNETELRLLFKDSIATGEDMFSPSFNEPEQEFYRPTIDVEEGSGDSEDETFGVHQGVSTGLTNDLGNASIFSKSNISSDPDECGRLGKRKSCEGSVQRKKQKLPASKVLADAMSVIATSSKKRATVLEEMKEANKETLNQIKEHTMGKKGDVSYDDIMDELLSFEEFQNDDPFLFKCIRLLKDNDNKIAFQKLRGNRRRLLAWLHDLCDVDYRA